MDETTSDRRRGPRFIAKYLYVLRGYRRRLVGITLLFLLISVFDITGIGMIGPFISAVTGRTDLWSIPIARKLFSTVGAHDGASAIVVFGVVLSVLYVVKGAVAYSVHRRTIGFSFKYRAEIVNRLVTAYLNMPYTFYVERNSATIIHSVTTNTRLLADELLIPSLRLISDAIVLLSLFALLCWIDLTGVLVILGMAGVALAVYAVFVRPRARAAGEKVAISHEQIMKGVNQAIWGIKEVRVFGIEHQIERQIAESADVNRRNLTKFYGLLYLPRYMMETVVMIAVIVISIIAVTSRQNGMDLVPNLAMFAVAGLRILPALTQVSSSIASMNYTGHALDNIYDDLRFIGTHPGEREGPGDKQRKPFKTLAFEHVDFRYTSSGHLALADINLTIQRGQSIGLIGASGAGKTTLVDMLLGFHKPVGGQILIDGIEMQEYGWSAWRRQIAYLPQSMALMDDTIERNIAFGISPGEIDLERLVRSIDSAQLGELIRRLPEGTKTVVGERGVRLSGGEKQRIALARGFYFDRDVFILDEATASLDTETERQVIEVIEEFHGQKTLIVIAHRLSTVRNCDVIYRLADGRIVQAGSYADVVRDPEPLPARS